MTPKLCGARARALLIALAAGTCLSEAAACSEHTAIGSARDAAVSYFAAFGRFERWAERSVESDVRLQGEQALRETLFAPVRRDREVLWADVQVDGRKLLTYRAPLPDAQLHFTPIEAPTLGRVQVALCDACGVPGKRDCVVIARPASRRPTRVRMAFCRDVAEPPAEKPEAVKPLAAALRTKPARRAAPRASSAKPDSVARVNAAAKR